MVLTGPRITIRPLNGADLSAMAAWRPFDDPLMADANWPQRSPDELRRWYACVRKDERRLLYTILDESRRVVGLLTLREIQGRHSARLGITLGADYVNRGYGSEALHLFLDYFFDELGFEKMVLDVAAHNRRAVRLYRKLGFKTIARRKKSPGMSLSFLRDPAYADFRRFFPRDWLGRRRLLYYEMELSRDGWKEVKR